MNMGSLRKSQKLAIALGVSFLSINTLNAQAATVSYRTNFEPFLPSTLTAGDTYNFRFRVHPNQPSRPYNIVKIIYHVLIPASNIFIPWYFPLLSSGSSSNFTSPPGSTFPDGADLTLVGSGAFAQTNSFTIPVDFGFTREDILEANLSFEFETDGLLPQDAIVADLFLNGTSIGSAEYYPVPEPGSVLGIFLFGSAMGLLNKKIRTKSSR